MENYNDLLQEERGRHAAALARLEAYAPLIRMVPGLCKLWSPNDRYEDDGERYTGMAYAFGSDRIGCLSVDLYMAPEDTFEDVAMLVLDELTLDDRFEFSCKDDYVDMGWRGWKYYYGDCHPESRKERPILMVRAWFEHSTQCRKVETGEYEPVMKIVCGDD